MRRILKNYGKWITAAVILAVGYCTVFGTGLPFNALDFSAEQVDSVEILDTWLSPAKVLIQEDIQFLIDSVNDSTRKGVSSFMRGGHPLTVRFHMKDGTTEELRVFSVDMYEGSPSVDLKRGTGLIGREGILEIESTLYLSCVELAYKYNPNGNNKDSYESWVSRGYVPRLKENKGPFGPADLPFEEPLDMTFSSGAGAWASWITFSSFSTLTVNQAQVVPARPAMHSSMPQMEEISTLTIMRSVMFFPLGTVNSSLIRTVLPSFLFYSFMGASACWANTVMPRSTDGALPPR